MANEEDKGARLVALAESYIRENLISCAEATCEDRVYASAPELVEKLAEIVGYFKGEEEDEEPKNWKDSIPW